jgi:hypothetical protein
MTLTTNQAGALPNSLSPMGAYGGAVMRRSCPNALPTHGQYCSVPLFFLEWASGFRVTRRKPIHRFKHPHFDHRSMPTRRRPGTSSLAIELCQRVTSADHHGATWRGCSSVRSAVARVSTCPTRHETAPAGADWGRHSSDATWGALGGVWASGKSPSYASRIRSKDWLTALLHATTGQCPSRPVAGRNAPPIARVAIQGRVGRSPRCGPARPHRV